MKKSIKIFALILFILFVFGITTSQAADPLTIDNTTSVDDENKPLPIDNTTSVEDMDKALRAGKGITGMTVYMKDWNANILCRQRFAKYSDKAIYQIDEKYDYPLEFNSDNGEYLGAYILAADVSVLCDITGMSERELRQLAYWHSLGQRKSGEDDSILYSIAIEYIEYKKNEKINPFTVNYEEAVKNIDGNVLTYGPIYIDYSYLKVSDGTNVLDEWGGFDYSFFVDDIQTTYGINLYYGDNKLSTEINNSNYYEVRTAEYDTGDYNEKAIYIKADLSVIGNDNVTINLKIKENKVDYTGYAYYVSGKNKDDVPEVHYCTDCTNALEEREEFSPENYNSLEIGDIVVRDETYYKLCEIESSSSSKNEFHFDGSHSEDDDISRK